MTPTIAALLKDLAQTPLDELTRQRVERFIAEGEDPDLQRALDALNQSAGSDQSTVQTAYALLMRSDGPQVL